MNFRPGGPSNFPSDGPPFRTPRLYSLGGSGTPKPEQLARWIPPIHRAFSFVAPLPEAVIQAVSIFQQAARASSSPWSVLAEKSCAGASTPSESSPLRVSASDFFEAL